jgi:hypothetical protein
MEVPVSMRSTKVGAAEAVGSLLASLPPLTNAQRHAFRDQFTPAECDAAAAGADAAAVHAEAVTWLPTVERTLVRRPLLVRRYGRARFAWLLECVRDLGDALHMQGAARAVKRAGVAARCVRDELVEALGILSCGDEAECARLVVSAGTADTVEALAASLHALARLADDWLDRDAPAAKALVASVDLTTADVEAARAAAHTVAGTAVEPPREGHTGHEPAALVRDAGRVILEMSLVMRVFERAHRWHPRVPRLAPGPATRARLSIVGCQT